MEFIPSFENRFQVIEPLKETAYINTYLGYDLQTDKPIILKVLPRKKAPPSFEIRLTQEASLVKKLQQFTNLAPIHLGGDSEKFFVALPYIEGITLRARLDKGTLSWEESVEIAIPILRELQLAHDHGVIHRDLKPENIILSGEGAERKVHLIDFASAWNESSHAMEGKPIVGTVFYLSPEQGGLTSHPLDQRSDLYSFGIILFECLTGRPPFDSDNVGQLLRDHLTVAPPDIRRLKPEVPKSLSNIVAHLLEKDPKNRYQTAKAALRDLEYLLEHWRKEKKDPSLIVGFSDSRSSLALPAFVGRTTELELLQSQREQASKGKGGILFVEALSGEGKTRLLSEFLQTIELKKTSIFFGQGVDQVARLPFQMLSGVAQNILDEAKADPLLRERLLTALGDRKGTLVSVLPPFASLFGSTPNESIGPEHFGEQRSIETLCLLLNCLGSKTRPAVVVLDDCQWADEMTLRLFQYWQQTKPSPSYLLILLAFRTEEVGSDHSLRNLCPLATVRLQPLNFDQVFVLTQTMAGQLPRDVVELIYTLSQGSPFMAAAILRGLVETGALCFKNGSWIFKTTSPLGVQPSEHAAIVLRSRFRVLPDSVLTLLKICAVLGKEFDLTLLSLVAHQSPTKIRERLGEAEDRHILWKSGETTYFFVHDKLRETLLELMGSEERRALHKLIAMKLKSDFPEMDFEIAYHFDAAGAPDEAFPHALRSAHKARSQYALEIAEVQFRIAQRGVKNGDLVTLRFIEENLGDVLMLRGQYEEAAKHLLLAKSMSNDEKVSASLIQKATLDHKLGELYFKKGDLNSAADSLENGLRELGYEVPQHLTGFVLRLIYETSIQALHTLLPSLFVGKEIPNENEAELLKARIHSRLAYTYWFKSGRIPCLWTHLRGMNIAERYPATLELAQTYSEHAPVATLVGQFQRGANYVARSLEIRKALKDSWGEGQSLNFYGVVLYCMGRYEEAIEKCSAGAEILKRTGDLWEVNTAEWHVAYCYYRLGELKRAIEISQRTYQAAYHIGDLHAIGISLSVWSKASCGRIPENFIQERLDKLDEGDIHTSVEILQAEGVRLLSQKSYEEAEKTFRRACDLACSKSMFSEYTVPAFAWLVTALRLQLERTAPSELNRRKALLKRCLQASRKALKFARRFQNNLPHALREQGILDVYRGKPDTALRRLKQALSLSEKQKAVCENARTVLVLSRLAHDVGWPASTEQRSWAIQTLLERGSTLSFEEEGLYKLEEPQPSVSLIDRFDSLLKVGRCIATAPTPGDLFQKVHEAFVSLLRAESCTLIRKTQSTYQMLFGAPRNISQALIQDTINKAEPVVFLGEQVLKPSDSLILSQIESAMCVPIFVRGTPEYFVYLTHKKVQRLFGADEQKIAGFIATIAGASLENLQGIESVKQNAERLLQSNQELERYAFLASHDLQEPLRNLQLTSQLLSKDLGTDVKPDTRILLDTIIDSSQRMRAMITDMLHFAQLNTEKGNFIIVPLTEVLELALANLASRIEEKQAILAYNQLPSVVGNRAQLVSLFQNIIANSLKFTASRRPKIEITSEVSDHTCVVHIQDNGMGFEPQYAETIFDLFRRLHHSQFYPGTGIGLAACRKIVNQHGGKIWAESVPSQGSVFHFTLRMPDRPFGTLSEKA